MDEWGISGNYKKLEAIFIEYLMAEFRSIPIPKGHICKSRNTCFKNMIFYTYIIKIQSFDGYQNFLFKTDFKNIVWQEVFDNGVRLDRNITIIEVWKNFGNGWKDELRKVSMAHGVYCYSNRQNP